jgi:curved DNA-binding protein CbpA
VKEKDYYRILEVDPSAESEVIDAAYRALTSKYHTDEEKGIIYRRLKEIDEAYKVLSHPVNRREYDKKRRREVQGHMMPLERPVAPRHWTECRGWRSDFKNPPTELEQSADTYSKFCKDGYYHIAIQPCFDGWLPRSVYQSMGFHITNFSVSVEAQFATDTGRESTCGIDFRRAGYFYRFEVSQEGLYRLTLHDDSLKTLLDWRFSEFLRHGCAPNILSVKAADRTIELHANGQLITGVTDDTRLYGYVGVFVASLDGDYAEVRFRDFQLIDLCNIVL